MDLTKLRVHPILYVYLLGIVIFWSCAVASRHVLAARQANQFTPKACEGFVLRDEVLSFEKSCSTPFNVLLSGKLYEVHPYVVVPSDLGYGSQETNANRWVESCHQHALHDDRPKEWHDAEMYWCREHVDENGRVHGFLLEPAGARQ